MTPRLLRISSPGRATAGLRSSDTEKQPVPGSYGAPPGWSGDGSLLIRRDLTPGLRDEHERVTRIAVAEEGRVVVRSWIEGLYGKGEGYAHTHEITVEKGRRIREIMEELRGGPVSPEAEEELLAIVDE